MWWFQTKLVGWLRTNNFLSSTLTQPGYLFPWIKQTIWQQPQHSHLSKLVSSSAQSQYNTQKQPTLKNFWIELLFLRKKWKSLKVSLTYQKMLIHCWCRRLIIFTNINTKHIRLLMMDQTMQWRNQGPY